MGFAAEVKQMPIEKLETDYDRVRRLVIAAFCHGDAPSNQWPLADFETRRTQPIKRHVKRPPAGMTAEERRDWSEFVNQSPDAFKVHAKESRRHGRSRLPIGDEDREGKRMLRAIRQLPNEQQAVLNYFYNPNSISQKYRVKCRAWDRLIPEFHGRNSDTKAVAMTMLEVLLPLYRDKIIKGRDYPARIWAEFSIITPAMWKKTYRGIWSTMEAVVIALDVEALELIR